MLFEVLGFPGHSVVKNLPANAGDTSLIPLRRSPGEENDNSLQYSCLGNPMDRGAWLATVHGVKKESDTTKWLTFEVLVTLQRKGRGRNELKFLENNSQVSLTLLSKCLAFNTHLKTIWVLQKSWKQCHKEFQNICTQVPQMLTANILSHLLYPYLFTYLSIYVTFPLNYRE